MTDIDHGATRRRRSERLIAQFWLMALGKSGRLPLPTTGRLRALERLAAEWEAVDEQEQSIPGSPMYLMLVLRVTKSGARKPNRSAADTLRRSSMQVCGIRSTPDALRAACAGFRVIW